MERLLAQGWDFQPGLTVCQTGPKIPAQAEFQKNLK